MNDENLGSTRVVVRDTIILFLLLNEVRRRIVMRVYGVSREDSNSVTVFAVGSMAGGGSTPARRECSESRVGHPSRRRPSEPGR